MSSKILAHKIDTWRLEDPVAWFYVIVQRIWNRIMALDETRAMSKTAIYAVWVESLINYRYVCLVRYACQSETSRRSWVSYPCEFFGGARRGISHMTNRSTTFKLSSTINTDRLHTAPRRCLARFTHQIRPCVRSLMRMLLISKIAKVYNILERKRKKYSAI